MATPFVFRPGAVLDRDVPLGRYLPRLPMGAATSWLGETVQAGSWVIDPFGASPQLALEAARGGYRILVAANNPISRFLIEFGATPPGADDMRAALAALASARLGEERLEPHIHSLYSTTCDYCGGEVNAEAFLWEKDAEGPYARIYTCPHCQHTGEYPATPEDIEKAAQYPAGGIHRSRALARVASSEDPIRENAEEALDVYPPRAVYALFTLINKLEGLSISEIQRDMLSALILYACDRANTLWQVPSARARPKQLTIPPKYRENNIWLALEQAIPLWANGQPATPMTYWPDTPGEEGGICLFEGRVKDLAGELGDIPIQAVVTAFPRPNQAYWTLSALWSGWLWGREAASPFAGVLQRRRYDWAWHTTALENSLRHLHQALETNTPFFGMVTENEAGFDAAVMVATDMAGFSLESIALRRKTGQTQCVWIKREVKPQPAPMEAAALIQSAAQDYLAQRGEPAQYLKLQAAGLSALAQYGKIDLPGQSPAEVYGEIRAALEFGMTGRTGFLRYRPSEHSFEVGLWWTSEQEEIQEPLADRVEMELLKFLLNSPGSPFVAVENAMCRVFPGLETPEQDLITTILESYGWEDKEGGWHVRESDLPHARREDVTEIGHLLIQMGEMLGFVVEERERAYTWHHLATNEILHFHVIASAILGRIVSDPQHDPKEGLIVLPGGRSNLVLYKMESNPRLEQDINQGWRFLKFRSIRRLWENPKLNRSNLAAQIALDPLSIDDPQMPLL
jgi:hypothetical protein